MNYLDACVYAEEMGIPRDRVEAILDDNEILCFCGDENGCCADDIRSYIKRRAAEFNAEGL